MPRLKPKHTRQKSRNAAEPAPGSPVSGRIALAERLLAILLTLLALFLHGVFLVKAGGFWRDEANSISLALRPTLAETWSEMRFDSFPILHLMLVRLWARLFGSTDASLRALGFAVGISVIAAIWLNARKLGSRAPLVPLLLVGGSPVMIRSLDSLRPLGIAAAVTIVAFTVVWRAVRKPDPFRLSMATVVLVLCVQALFQSVPLLLAMGVAAVSVGLLRGGLRQASLLLVPFCVAALSLLPYAAQLHEAGSWSSLTANPSGPNGLPTALLDAVRSPTGWSIALWVAMTTLAVLGALKAMARKRPGHGAEQERDQLLLYSGVTFLVSVAGFLLFLVYVVGSIAYQSWHVVPVLVLAVVSLGPLVEQATARGIWRVCYLLAISAAAAAIMLPAARNLTMRTTSMDLAATVIGREARANDLVVLNPWYHGVSFGRYYRGSAPWITFPVLSETAVHRYDLLKERMNNPESIREDVTRVSAALRQGGRVWVVGSLEAVRPGQPITVLPPPPLPETGWWSGRYVARWSQLLMGILTTHAPKASMVSLDADRPVNPQESPRVFVFQGWANP